MSNHTRLMPLDLYDILWFEDEDLADAVTAWYRSHGDDAIGRIMCNMIWNGELESYELRFEVYDFDRDAERSAWRTGTVYVWFGGGGEMKGARWDAVPVNDWCRTDKWYLRPLWLSGLFWHLIPDGVKAQDTDWTDDPFFGAADCTPKRKGE